MSLDDPAYVREQYATEDGLAARAAVYAGSGPDARDVVVDALRALAPARVLEVGCGWGDLAARIAEELACAVVASDQSERMVELARSRGVDAQVADVRELPFADGAFSAVVAAWVLFHVPDLDGALAEIARVLEPGGALVAVTNGQTHLAELWALVGRTQPAASPSFRAENGAAVLGRRFVQVERHDVPGPVTFADADAVRRYVSSSSLGADYAEQVPGLVAPLTATKVNAVFVAKKAR